MAAAKEERAASSSPLRCCQSNDSLTSASSTNEQLCETKNKYVISPKKESCNNNNKYQLVNSEVKKYHFPKKQACDVNFQDITYTTWTWSMMKFQKRKSYFNKLLIEITAGSYN